MLRKILAAALGAFLILGWLLAACGSENTPTAVPVAGSSVQTTVATPTTAATTVAPTTTVPPTTTAATTVAPTTSAPTTTAPTTTVPPTTSAPTTAAPTKVATTAAPTTAAPNANLEKGLQLFQQSGCAGCHGGEKATGGVGPRLNNITFPYEGLLRQVRSGSGIMPAFSPEVLSDTNVRLIYDYLISLKK